MLIFLDIDGVMVLAKGWKRPELLDDGFPSFSDKAIRVLQNLITANTTVILTTSHKSKFGPKEWKSIFKKRGLHINKLKSLQDNPNNLTRKDEIVHWFNSNIVNEEFIIIDDDKSLNALPDYIKDNLIQTSPMIGLTDSHLEEIKLVLERNFQIK